MSYATFMECLVSAQIDGSALTNSTSATSIIPPHAKITLPAGNFFYIGKKMRIKASGRISNVVTTPGTLTLDIRFGSVIVFTSQAMSLNTTAKTNVTWEVEIDLTCRAIGASTSANMMGTGKFISEAVVGAASGTTITTLMPASAPAVGTGFDSTAAQTVDMFATFSVNTATTSIQVHEYEVLALN
jgi:hypothetical protein